MNQFLIVNTRDGENPNVLGATYINEVFTPQLACSTDGSVPTSLTCSKWSLVQFQNGLYYLQINDPNGNPHALAVSPATSGTICELVPLNATNLANSNALWAFPYDARIILMYSQSKDNALSLDTGSYPNIMVYDFCSSVNQTWQFGTSLQSLSTLPPGVTIPG